MARYTQAELDQLKQSIDLVALVQSKGIKLVPHGKDLKGLCPFHKDNNPSMIITPGKNLFNCPACGSGGDVISFIQKYEGVSFTHAVELLKNGDLSNFVRASDPTKRSSIRTLKSPLDFNADDHVQIRQVMDYYHETLCDSAPAINFLKKRGIYSEELIKKFKLGFSDRTLGLRLPNKQRKEGREVRKKLENVGLFRASGHEHFNGGVVFPIIDKQGNISEIYGRKLNDNNKSNGAHSHMYLPGPHVGV